MSSSNSNSNQSSPNVSDDDVIAPQPITQPKARKERSDKGKSRKYHKKVMSPETVVDTSDEEETVIGDVTANDAHEDTSGITQQEHDVVTEVAQSAVTSAEIVEQKSGKKGTKYPEDEIDIVREIITTNTDKLVLTNRQLEIAYWIESENIKAENRVNCYTDADCKIRKKMTVKGKEVSVPFGKSEKASCAFEASCDKAFFLELQRHYRQEDGSIYTLQAFQHAINHWFFKHFNIGNAYARSDGFVDTNKNGKVIGLSGVPEEFFANDFLQGFLMTDEGINQLEVGEEAQRIKRSANKAVKGTNKTKEQRTKNIVQATANMDDDELAQQIAMLQALSKKRMVAKESDIESDIGSDEASASK